MLPFCISAIFIYLDTKLVFFLLKKQNLLVRSLLKRTQECVILLKGILDGVRKDERKFHYTDRSIRFATRHRSVVNHDPISKNNVTYYHVMCVIYDTLISLVIIYYFSLYLVIHLVPIII